MRNRWRFDKLGASGRSVLSANGAWILAAVAMIAGAPAAADVFSPGELSRPHAHLEGLRHCTDCHPAGGKLSEERCLACHDALAERISSGQGFHGRMKQAERAACQSCHHEHQGRDFELVKWIPSRAGFDHASAGWALAGKHAQVQCDGCHERRRIAQASARKLLDEHPSARTYLGLPERCAACHFDEHRGQLGDKCDACHGAAAWAPASGFDHARTDYALTGKHQKVPCAKCHPTRQDEKTAAGAFPAPRQRTFVAYADLPHQSCLDCHADPHTGRFGAACESCHSTAGWLQVTTSATQARFHDKTRYPLRGLHASVACKSCHGPFPGVAAKFRGLPFDACTRCHADAHIGQLARADRPAPDCEACHSVSGFSPARFEAEDHAKTRYPLAGAHLATACNACHPDDAGLRRRVPAEVVKEQARRNRPVRISGAVLALPGKGGQCDDCHADPHQGQFARLAPVRACAECHAVASFRPLSFDHARDARWPLEGAHAKAACAGCHAGAPVAYRGTARACDGCHADVHAGQLARDGRSDCARCHDTGAFKPSLFKHEPPFTDFRLGGRHAKVACAGCHPDVPVREGVAVRRYEPTPTACDGCHADFHRGAFAGFRLASFAGDIEGSRCESCHSAEGWTPARFAHDRTGFALQGRHAAIDCSACHPVSFTAPVAKGCGGCHRDPHRGELGVRCEGCHAAQNGWRSSFGPDAHRRTAFPLIGRHGALPCAECHVAQANRLFSGVPASCVSCHQQDFDRTRMSAVDHPSAGFSTECRQCHDGWTFKTGLLPGHDACFGLGGPHAGITCLQCHTSIPPPSPLGPCASGTAACTGCHAHSCARTDPEHGEVLGYQCKDRKCYECHRFSSSH